MASESAYRSRVLGIMDELGQMADDRAARMLRIIGEMRDELAAEIVAGAGAADAFDLAQLQRTRAGLEALSARTRGRLAAEVAAHTADAASLGFAMQPEALARAGIAVGFGEPDTRQVDLAAQHSALLIRSVSDQARAEIDQAMLRSVIQRDRPAQTARAIQRVLATQPDRQTGRMGSLPAQAERVLRTEGLTIVNLANYTRMAETAAKFPGAKKVWLHGGGGKTPRPYHRNVLHGQVIPFSQDFVVRDGGHTTKAFGPQDPALPAASRINCFPPNALARGAYLLALKSRYTGPMVHLELDGGVRLSATVNHPVLTSRGWVPAGEVREGDGLVCYRDDIGGCGDGPNAQDSPSTVEDIFNAFAANGRVGAAVEVGLDLHGDAQVGDAYIEIVAVNRQLLDAVKAGLRHDGRYLWDEELFSAGALPANGPAPSLVVGDGPPAGCPVCGGGDGVDVARAQRFEPGELERLGFPASPAAHPAPVEHLGDGPAPGPVPIGEVGHEGAALVELDYLVLRQAGAVPERNDSPLAHGSQERLVGNTVPDGQGGQRNEGGGVFLRDIVSKRIGQFDGHVYDLQSEHGLILTSIADTAVHAQVWAVASNCTCSLGLVLPDFGSYDDISGALARARGVRSRLQAAWANEQT